MSETARARGFESWAYAISIAAVFLAACSEPAPDPPDPSLMGCSWGSYETGDDGGFGDGEFEELINSLEFQDYLEQYVISDSDERWLIESDIVTHDFSDVISAYNRFRHHTEGQRLQPTAPSSFRGTVACDSELNIDRIWSPSDKLALTYCFDSSWDEVPALRTSAINSMSASTLAWESAADINFIATEHGEVCSHATASFVVRYRGSECLWGILCGVRGMAFFPNAPQHERMLDLWLNAFVDGQAALDAVVLHELGHILGLWHEHGRFPQQGICSLSSVENGAARGVTEADPDSVMGYPQCLNTNPVPPHPSALDRTTVQFLYNLPRPLLGGSLAPPDPGTLVWHRPTYGDHVVWEPNQDQASFGFAETTLCYSPDCSLGASPHWKPILYRNDTTVDVLMYGPGLFEERRFTGLNASLSSSSPGVLFSSVDVPVLLDGFFGANDRSVWWIRPGHPSDPLWRNLDGTIVSDVTFNDRPFTDEHFSAALGKLIYNRSSVFWVSPTSTHGYLIYTVNDALQQMVIDKKQCSLADGVHYNPVPGDYDGNSTDEIAWYDYDAGTVTVWPSMTNCISSHTIDIGKAKLAAIHVGAKDRLMAYRPQSGTVQFYDAITGAATTPRLIQRDASPVLRDFDGDGCTDILWFSPHLASSLLWHSLCNGAFVESSVIHPDSAYPLGFGLGHGRP
ncbi:MAG: hypothetical protein R6X02_20385 [Enhygromyxa sp.]